MKKLLLLFTLFFTTSNYASDDGLSFYPRASFVFNDPIMGDYGYLGGLVGDWDTGEIQGVSIRAGIGEEAYKINLSYTVNVLYLAGGDLGISYFQTKDEPNIHLSNKKEGLLVEVSFKMFFIDTIATFAEEDVFIRFGIGF